MTGGAGFIGSHLVDRLLAEGHGVRVLDDLSSGLAANVADEATLIEGDVADEATVERAIRGCDVVFHLAARGSVPRSIEFPLATDRTNTHGTLTVLKAAVDAGVPRVVFASSSSVYGGASPVPTPETAPLVPRSPYAVSKVAAEQYCRVFREVYGLGTVTLRYFNVYGPRQRPDSDYAAVIPRFIEAVTKGDAAVIHGDGLQERDFTFVDDVVAANIATLASSPESTAGRAYNVAGGRPVNVVDLLASVGRALGVDPQRVHVEARPGDVRRSGADVRAAAADLGHTCHVGLDDGLRRTVAWFAARPTPA